MKRKMDWDDKEESGKEDNSTSDEESDDEEPRIKDVLNNLSNAVSRKDASELLHSMATSRDILFWTASGLLLRNQRKIPVTNISELVEYVLLPHHEDVAKPRALNTFLDGLVELGINKRLIKNKKILSGLGIKRKNKLTRKMRETRPITMTRTKPLLKIVKPMSFRTAPRKAMEKKRLRITTLKIQP